MDGALELTRVGDSETGALPEVGLGVGQFWVGLGA
jgi:hypothetical protein